jgi:hypothetical protein
MSDEGRKNRIFAASEIRLRMTTILQCSVVLETRGEFSAALILLDHLIEMELKDANEQAVDEDYEPIIRLTRDNREDHRNHLLKAIAARNRPI